MPDLTSNISYADELDDAARRIEEISHGDLAIILRRAALRLRNTVQVPLEPDLEMALKRIAIVQDVDRGELIRAIVKDWLITSGHMPVLELDDEGRGGSRF